ncbi:MAG: phosphatidylserine/phosphatidylglycerophosphate/cardiolipin synthase family protein [Pseudomonadota bacterium]|nr:phosphatidylserine/phosphatidylglycerophosphate/cardiolipin synthase family protein [Pseudomonadota bacterium]
MRPLPCLEDERKPGAIWYVIFRQSPKSPAWRSPGLLFCLTLASLAWGCSHTSKQGLPPESVVQGVDGQQEAVVLTRPAKAVDAFLLGEDLFFSYLEGELVRYGHSNADARENLSLHQEWIPVYQVHPVDAGAFGSKATGAQSVTTVGSEHWEQFLTNLEETLVPDEPRQGALIQVRDHEFFYYRDTQGNLHWNEKLSLRPPDVPLVYNYRLEDLEAVMGASLHDYLSDAGVDLDVTLVLIDTGETGNAARPFVFFAPEQRKLGFLSLQPSTFGSMPTAYATDTGKLGWHLTRSHLFELFNRPVSFLSRGMFFVVDTITDATRGVVIRTFRFPALDEKTIPPLNEGPGMDLEEWERELDKKIGPNTLTGKMELLVGGDAFFPRYIDAVTQARSSIKIRTYIFDRDDFATEFADLLKRRSQETEVRIMLDGLGTLMAQRKSAGTMPSDYEAPLGITLYLTEDSSIELRSLTNPWFAGDHTKTSIIDGERAFIGGMNIGREYRWEWHDMMMEVSGPIVKFIDREFDKTWAHAQVLGDFVYSGYMIANPEPDYTGDGYPIRPLLTLPRKSQIYRAQLEALKHSKRRVVVENAYLSDTEIIYELARARLRGVDVRVIVPLEGNHGIMNASNVIAVNTLLRYGARVFTYPGMSHIKAANYDGWVCLGSANFDKLSFRVNKEMNLATSHPEFVRQLDETVFDADMEAAVEIVEPLPEGWGNSFASLIATQL